MKTLFHVTFLLLVLVIFSMAEDSDRISTENKNITIIHGQSTADGKSDISERILEECIVSLPRTNELDPVISSSSQYLKEINGDPNKNEFVKYYSASIDINYMLYQKVLVIVATNTVQGKEPAMKVVEKHLKQTKHLESNSSNGDLFAGRSHREYYFSSSNAAKEDVLKQAAAWIRQQSAVICNK